MFTWLYNGDPAWDPFLFSDYKTRYMLTAMCVSFRYPEAIPMEDLRSVTIIFKL